MAAAENSEEASLIREDPEATDTGINQDADLAKQLQEQEGSSVVEPNPTCHDDAALAQQLQAEENARANAAAYPQADPQHRVYLAEHVQPNGNSEPNPSTSGGRRFGDAVEYHDITFTVLWLVVFVAFVAISVFLLTGGIHSKHTVKTSAIVAWIVFLVCACLCTAVLACLWLVLLRKFPKECIIGSCVAQISFMMMLCVLCFVLGSIIYGFIFFLLAIICGCYFYMVQKHIPFSAAIMAIVGSVIKTYPQCVWLSVASLLPHILVIAIFVAAAIAILQSVDHGVGMEVGPKCLLFFLAFAMFWSTQIIRNVVHMSVGGVTATWYFLAGPNNDGPPNPLWRSTKRALTTSFGSICFGSLLVAFVQTLRFMVRSQDDGFCAVCVDCFLSCIEGMLAFINKYAFTYIAIYGGNFCDGGKATWSLLKERGFDTIINDDLTETVCCILSVATGLIVGITVGLTAWACGVKDALLLAFVSLAVGYLLCLYVLTVVDSGVATMFVCFAEDPGQLESSRPPLHAALRNAWLERYGEDDWGVRMYSGRPCTQ